jgi:hypothetical protein
VRRLTAGGQAYTLAGIVFLDVDPAVEIAAIKQLQTVEGYGGYALNALLSARESRDDAVSAAAQEALHAGRAVGMEAMAVLASYLKESDDRAATQAAEMLLAQGEHGAGAIDAAVAAIAERGAAMQPERLVMTLRFLRMQGLKAKAAGPLLAKMLGDDRLKPQNAEHLNLYANVLATLGDVGVPDEAAAVVLKTLRGPSTEPEFSAAIHAAGGLPAPGKEVMDLLLKQLEKPTYDVQTIDTRTWIFEVYPSGDQGTAAQIEAMRTLAKIGDDRARQAIPALKEWAKIELTGPGLGASFKDEAEKAIAAAAFSPGPRAGELKSLRFSPTPSRYFPRGGMGRRLP